MWKIMVVDDEPKIRRGLCQFLENSGLPLEICAQAEDGETAMELLHIKMPDIVLLDISMPNMDGLEFLAAVKANNLKAKCIVITGFDQFSFAQASVSLRAFAYLLKPIDEMVLIENLMSAIAELESESTQTHKNQQVMFQLEKNQTLLWNNFVKKWILGTLTPSQLETEMIYWNLVWPDKAYITLIKPNFSTSKISFWHEQSLILFCVTNIASELMKELVVHFFGQDEKDCGVIISEQRPSTEQLAELSQTIMQHLQTHCQIDSMEITSPGCMTECINIMKTHIKEMETINPLLEKLKNYIDHNFHNPGLSLMDVATDLCVSPSYISLLVKTALQSNFVDYLTEKRMSEARLLMANPKIKLTLIAKKVGYANLHYFSTVFKKQTGMSPSVYRENFFD